MNFLAHIFLSGSDDDIKIGNFIGDYVKGKAYHIYPDKIKEGILLHRFIDTFTDKSKYTHQAKSFFTPKYRKYSGIVIDIVYDHFLANNWKQYSSVELIDYINYFHCLVQKNTNMLPSAVQEMIPRLIANNRLYSYKSIEGVRFVLSKMATYTTLPDHADFAIDILQANYTDLNGLFNNFFFFF